MGVPSFSQKGSREGAAHERKNTPALNKPPRGTRGQIEVMRRAFRRYCLSVYMPKSLYTKLQLRRFTGRGRTRKKKYAGPKHTLAEPHRQHKAKVPVDGCCIP